MRFSKTFGTAMYAITSARGLEAESAVNIADNIQEKVYSCNILLFYQDIYKS
jgi:hypothetical protein